MSRAMVKEKTLFGVKIYFDLSRSILGMTELPAHFVAANGARMLIVGEPHADVLQLAIAEAGFNRVHVDRHPAGEGTTGVLLDLVA